MAIDIGTTTGQLIGAIQSQLKSGWSTISSFVTTQSKMLATQAAWIAQDRVVGSLRNDDDLFNFFIQQLKDSIKSFAHTVAALTVLTLEKAWNAAVGVLWGAINGVLQGAGLGGLIPPAAPII